jgi:hypothetical protein
VAAEPDPFEWTAGPSWTFSQVREGFEHRSLAWFGNANEIWLLAWENVVNPTTGGGDGTRTHDFDLAKVAL